MRKEPWDPRAPKITSRPARPVPGQPDWEFVANIGDEHPFEHGGYFIYHDKTEKYGYEAELLVVDEARGGRATYRIYRVPLDPLKLVNDYLVPLSYEPGWAHPVEQYAEWFNRDLERVADNIGSTKEDLEKAFISTNPIARADAYRAVGDYHGWENLDSYPLTNLSRATVEKRYAEVVGRGRR